MQTTDQPPTSCHLYDYFETAATHQYQLEIIDKNKQHYLGYINTLFINEKRQECIKFETTEQQVIIPIPTISQVTAITKNPYFSTLSL